ncbi:MAG: preprotein translocase subunit SecE [Elusimicrobia bacterium]|nr:preprotein translocase subunit SecE [Elusimicrobiota bacterium]
MPPLVQFFKEAWNELKLVNWLSRKQVIASTVVIILLVIVVAIFVGVIDLVLTRVLAVLL